ncbi:MAG: hypothetical protein K0S54_961, partial [Alphaproteobacteria bacterium]|nr:hypothetical protein [Alphaproteobacteria bacterium]
MGRDFGLALGDPRKGSAARQGAGKPVSRLTRFISQDIVCCCAFRSARERCRHSICRALRPWPSAADGKDRSAEKRDADVRGRGGHGSKGSCRLSVGCSRFAAHPSSRPGPRAVGSARLRRRFVHRGRSEHCRETSSQGAEALRQWQGRGWVLSSLTGSSEASGVPRRSDTALAHLRKFSRAAAPDASLISWNARPCQSRFGGRAFLFHKRLNLASPHHRWRCGLSQPGAGSGRETCGRTGFGHV